MSEPRSRVVRAGARDSNRDAPGAIDSNRDVPGAIDSNRDTPGAIDSNRDVPGAIDSNRDALGCDIFQQRRAGSERFQQRCIGSDRLPTFINSGLDLRLDWRSDRDVPGTGCSGSSLNLGYNFRRSHFGSFDAKSEYNAITILKRLLVNKERLQFNKADRNGVF